MTNQEAFYIVGNIPIPTDDNNYDICQYQEAKAIALDCIQKIDNIQNAKKDIEKLEIMMAKFFEDWDCFKELTMLESMGLEIVSSGMQTLGYILDQIK